MKRGAVLAAALAAVIAARLADPRIDGIPLELIPQGVSAHDVAGAGHVFVRRDGEVLYAFGARTRGGHAVVWCAPRDPLGRRIGGDVFWSPETLALYDGYGNLSRAGSAGEDAMVPRRTSVDTQLVLRVSRARPRLPAPRRGVPPEIKKFYEDWLNQVNAPPTPVRLEWCPISVT